MQISQEDQEPAINHAAFIQITMLLYPGYTGWYVNQEKRKRKETKKKKKKKKEKKGFSKAK